MTHTYHLLHPPTSILFHRHLSPHQQLVRFNTHKFTHSTLILYPRFLNLSNISAGCAGPSPASTVSLPSSTALPIASLSTPSTTTQPSAASSSFYLSNSFPPPKQTSSF
ncbi:hypothetical protein ABFS83_13G054200 [Erythranthe nasuta]